MLNRAGDVNLISNPPDDGTVAARAAFIEEWTAELAQGGLQTIVALVPEKMSTCGTAPGSICRLTRIRTASTRVAPPRATTS